MDFSKIKFALAPLAGVSDISFRKLCAAHGAPYAVTEMISAKAIHYNDKKTVCLARIDASEAACAVQLFGREPGIIAEAAKRLADGEFSAGGKLPCAIDLNFGCPVKKIVSNGEGSALMREPELAAAIVESAVKAQDLPVTVKFRAGWDDGHINAPEFAKRLEAAGASMICIHGRTREEMYGPKVHLDVIAAVKAAVKIPVLANGGVMTAADAVKMLEATHADGVMIARGAMGNPWIFDELNAAFGGGPPYTRPSEKEVIETALLHARLMIGDKGENTGVREARKHIAWYTRGMKGSAALRDEINRANCYAELEALLSKVGADT